MAGEQVLFASTYPLVYKVVAFSWVRSNQCPH